MAPLQIIGAIIAVLLSALGVVVGAPTEPWRCTICADSNYQTATLSHGVTAYQAGPVDGVPVVIVHGGTLGSMAYQGYVPPLVEAGWRVIIYDQYGRGFSDRPKNKLSIDVMRRQLRDLLTIWKLKKRICSAYSAAIIAALPLNMATAYGLSSAGH